jgi:hypothetical protein
MTNAQQESIKCRKIGGASPGAIGNQELLFHEQAVSDDGSYTSWPQKFGDRG